MVPDKSKSFNYISSEYGSIGSIYITGGGFVKKEIKGISPDSNFGWYEFTYQKSPSRSNSGAMSNMDKLKVMRIPRCIINVNYMDYQDYKDLRYIFTHEKRFDVTYFDMDSATWITRNMYCASNEKDKFLILNKSLIGVINYKIELNGTLLDEISTIVDGLEISSIVMYAINYNTEGHGDIPSISNIYRSHNVTLSNGEGIINPPQGKHITGWETRNTSNVVTGYYGLGQSITVWDNLTLYPTWGNN